MEFHGISPILISPTGFFNLPRENRGCIALDRVTVMLPVSDFGALYALASVGGLGGLVAGRAAFPVWKDLQSPVLDRILVFDVVR